jgi:Flp pilus assembly protein TadB
MPSFPGGLPGLTTTLLAVLGGALAGGGLLLLAVAVRGLPPPPPGRPPSSERIAELARFMSRRGGIAAVAGLAVLVVTRWPVAAAATGVLVFSWSALFGGAAAERVGMQRVEALASWTESLRDTIAGAVGLEQAIPSSIRAAAPALQPHLRVLVDRLRTRMPLPAALERFADDLDDPSADLIIAALILNARLRGPGLREVLGALAASARDEVQMRQRVSAERRSTRRSVQIVVAVTVAAVFLLVVFNRDYVEPYGDTLGQLVLLVVIALFAAGFFWLRKLADFTGPTRFLTGAPPGAVPLGSPVAAEASVQPGGRP